MKVVRSINNVVKYRYVKRLLKYSKEVFLLHYITTLVLATVLSSTTPTRDCVSFISLHPAHIRIPVPLGVCGVCAGHTCPAQHVYKRHYSR